MLISDNVSPTNTHGRVRLPTLVAARYTARLALDDASKEAVYRLRYEAYLSQGHVEPNKTGLFSDMYDAMANTTSIMIEVDGKTVASVRVCLLSLGSTQRSAAVDLYPEKVEELLSSNQSAGYGQRGVEVNRMVRSPEYGNNQGLVFLLYRMAGCVAMMTHAQVILACVRSHHVSFYKRLGYTNVAGPRPYPGLNCNMELLSCTREAFDRIRAAYPVIDPLAATTGPLDGFLAGEPVALSIA